MSSGPVSKRIQEIEAAFFERKEIVGLIEDADIYKDVPLIQIYASLLTFFSFSQKNILSKLPVYTNRLEKIDLNYREGLHYIALKQLHHSDLENAFHEYQKILSLYPEDKVALIMLETCGFLSGQFEQILPTYQKLSKFYEEDINFIGMQAFLLCHLNQNDEALLLIKEALKKAPHNAWIQHVYMHVISELGICSQQEFTSLESLRGDWKKQSRFFEGHNTMHLVNLWLHSGKRIENFDGLYHEHIWGEAKDLLFEQNDAFLTLYNLELSGFTISKVLWDDLAQHAKQYVEDFFTPYLTITSILSVAKSDINAAYSSFKKYISFCKTLDPASQKYKAWNQLGIPILQGCLFFIDGKYEQAKTLLSDKLDTRLLGHSDEQRAIFTAIYRKLQDLH